MIEEKQELCYGCMNKLDADGHCRFCNYNNGSPMLIRTYLAPGTILDDRYLVGKILSFNGEGVSYIGYDRVTNEKTVIKEYFPDTLCTRAEDGEKILVNPDCLAKYKTFMSEFGEVYKVLSRMRNLPHIVPAVDMFVQNNTTYAITEYVEGVSLKKFLQENTGMLTWEQVKKIFPPIFTTLSLIHNAGIIHRGICPDNIIVTIKGELKLIGFSISSIRTFNTELTPELYSGYAAPEQYTSLDWQGTWTDVYAISAVLYRMLTGTVPPEAHSRTIRDTIIDPIRLNPSVPLHVSRVIMRGLEVKGENRIRTITELVTELFEQPKFVEHQKGATQTIPVTKPQVKRTSNAKKQPEDKFKKILPSVLGVSMVIVIMCLAVFLIYQIFFAQGTDDRDDSGSQSSLGQSTAVTTTAPVTSYINEGTTTAVTEENSDLGHGAIMPNIVGYQYEGIRETIEKDFTVELVHDYSNEHTSGTVIDQSIPPDTEYDPEYKNRLVITVSLGSETVIIPDFQNRTQADYISELEELGIKYAIIKVNSDTVSAGYVVETDKKTGTEINVKNGEVLTVTVSAGPRQTETQPVTSEQESSSSEPTEEE